MLVAGVAIQASIISPLASLVLGRREEDENFQFFLNVKEAMLALSLDEDDGAGPNVSGFRADLHASAAAHDIVKLVFAVRLLRISCAGGENVDTGAHRGNTKKFEVEFGFSGAIAIQVVDVEEVGKTHEVIGPSVDRVICS
jgi:hypothetical protein